MLKASLLSVLCSLTMLLSGWKNSSLKDITKPYLGEYECTQAILGKENYLDRMAFISLNLGKDNQFVLSFCEKGKTKQTLQGKYSYDKDKQVIIFENEKWNVFAREFPLKNGELYIHIRIGKQTLLLRFEQK